MGISSAEDKIRSLCESGDITRGLTLAIETYGPELLGYLASRVRNEDSAREIFAEACIDLWVGIGKFEWRSSFRTWAYTVTRNASYRYLSKGARQTPVAELPEIVAHARTATVTFLRTEVKDRVQQLREKLSAEEQELLILRVDRNLPWEDIAAITLGTADEAHEEKDVERQAAALRKRFERTIGRLRKLAKEAGLLES